MDKRNTPYLSRSARYELSEDIGRNHSEAPTLGDVISARLGRRSLMRGTLAATAIGALTPPAALLTVGAAKAAVGSFGFKEIEAGVDEDHHVAEGYSADVLIRWGDPVVAGAPAFDPEAQTADAQEMQFGYNNDFVGYVPLPRGSATPDHGLLVVNHEYTNAELMFPGLADAEGNYEIDALTREQVEIEMAAHGLSVVEVRRGTDGKWSVVPDSTYNRRITARSTRMRISGPAAGHPRLQTNADPTGTTVIGTFNNCAGGITPWGTILTAEENFHGYFRGELTEDMPEYRNYKRLGVGAGEYAWANYHVRFDLAKEPNEPNRFGWMVEVNPYDPNSTPVKRTALGRFKHEGAGMIVNADGRLVAYMGDDERFDYLYKYVSKGRVDLQNPEANASILDDGTLYVARFEESGKVTWLPLVHGEGPLTAENGFESQADVLIETRRAADLLKATPMDRPEEVEPNPRTGKVYVMLTNNTRRSADQVDGPNPRAENAFGHIIEITPDNGDHAAETSGWEVLVKCGDPSDPAHGALWNPAVSENGWFGSPDNCAIDNQGRLWITTDGNNYAYSGRTDGVWAMETEGELRGTSKLFYRVPVGAEMCGPAFTPDDETLFVAVQHPADGGEEWPEFGRPSTYDDPSTRWPDFDPNMPVRPSVVAITKNGGGVIGS